MQLDGRGRQRETSGYWAREGSDNGGEGKRLLSSSFGETLLISGLCIDYNELKR